MEATGKKIHSLSTWTGEKLGTFLSLASCDTQGNKF